MPQRTYIAIDLKSFYASVECAERGLDALNTNLVVADPSRTEKTICLAVSPSLKAFGIPGRARLFEVVQRVKEINAQRRSKAGKGGFKGSSNVASELAANPSLELDYIVAPPRMALYMEYSTRIYSIYLKYIAPEDIHVYSIDEVFMDVTDYLAAYGLTARELAVKMVRDVLSQTGITATAGIGTNMYLCKIAMDVEAKHVQADSDGVRIAELDEMSYREKLWDHFPITDFWRVGAGTAKRLADHGMFTMGDVARCSVGGPADVHNEDLLYRLFGINAELLIDHAWGWEPCTIKEIKAYKPESQSISQGQVLQHPYSFEEGLIIVKEMADMVSLDLVDKSLVTDQIVLSVGYDAEGFSTESYKGEIAADYYGRIMPKMAHGSINLDRFTSSSTMIVEAAAKLFSEIVDPKLSVRRMYVVANHVVTEQEAAESRKEEQLSIFDIPAFGKNFNAAGEQTAKDSEPTEEDIQKALKAENDVQKTLIEIKKKYGKNAILKGMNLQDAATAKSRNRQIGGHKA